MTHDIHSSHDRRGRERVPVLLISGVEESAMLSATVSLQFGLPDAVAVQHVIDPARQTLTRTVSDVTGVIDLEEIDLAHACVTCAIREDIVPTLERLAETGRWGSIVACLPIAAEAVQVCRALSWTPEAAPHVSIASVVTALEADSVIEDLLGEDLLAERGLATSVEDRRGVAEVAAAMVEYADLVCLSHEPVPEGLDLVRILARPGAPIVRDPSVLDAVGLAVGVHRHQLVEAWVSAVRRGPLPPVTSSAVWRLDLTSERPFHPLRFQDELATLGGGPRRSRGCFWLPTRADDICAWEAAGGQASVGTTRQWGRETPLTRFVVVGLDDRADEVIAAFDRCLLSDEELTARGGTWADTWDGLEPWLGPIRRIA